MAEIKSSIIAGLVFAIVFGFYFSLWYEVETAIITGSVAGLAFGLSLYFFVTSKTVKQQTQIENEEGKKIIYSGAANHFMKMEGVGGKLYLLEDQLQFQSHKFNIQNHSLTIDLNQIQQVHYYNTLGLIPNGLAVHISDGRVEKFVVNGRKKWLDEIEKLRKV